MNLLNKAQADELFRREVVLLGVEDCVPEYRVAAMFGEGAVGHVHNIQNESRRCWSEYGAGGYTLNYVTYRGFLAAVSFYNVQQLRQEAQQE